MLKMHKTIVGRAAFPDFKDVKWVNHAYLVPNRILRSKKGFKVYKKFFLAIKVDIPVSI